FTGEAALLIDATGAEVLRLVPLDRVPGRGCRDRGAAAGSHRDCRGGVTFSREAHLLLRLRADLPVSSQPVLLLPGLDLRHRAGANLPVHLRADDLLHGGVIQRPLVLHLIPGRDVPEVPGLADTAALSPRPAVQEAVLLGPRLDRARVDVDSEAVLVVGAEVGGCDGDAAGLARPDRPGVGTVSAVLPAPAHACVVRLEQGDLLSVGAQRGPDLE